MLAMWLIFKIPMWIAIVSVVGIIAFIVTKGLGPIKTFIGSVFSRPKTPSGPDTGVVGEKLTYTTKGTDPLGVHKFQWDWDNPETEPELGDKWKDEKESHVYNEPGTYELRVRERCPWWIFLTRWSKTKTVVISPKPATRRRRKKSEDTDQAE